MNGTGVLLDSVILIDHLNGIPAATAYLRTIGAAAHISAITRAEVLTGAEGSERQLLARFLDCFTFHALDLDVADLAAELRHLHGWKLPDAFQAAVAQHYNLALATRNHKDFDPKQHLFVVIPYKLQRK
jgi:predicted nucleic acid-binding protein